MSLRTKITTAVLVAGGPSRKPASVAQRVFMLRLATSAPSPVSWH